MRLTLLLSDTLSAAKKFLLPRLGAFVPCTRNKTLMPSDWSCEKAGFRAQALPLDDPTRVEAMKQHLRKSFYVEAPIPIALGLAKAKEGSKVYAQLEKEMNLYLGSGVSMECVRKSDGELIGSGLSVAWEVDPEYEVLDIPQPLWHNAAAEIAQEVCPEEPAAVWRDYQFQHFYNVTQRILRRQPEIRVAFYMGVFAMEEEARSCGLTQEIFRRFGALLENGLIVTQSNFSGFDKFVYKMMKDVKLEDEMAYKDEKLMLGGEQVFQKIAGLGHMRFFSGKTM